MKASVALLLSCLFCFSCVPPAKEDSASLTGQGEWNPDLPEEFFVQQNQPEGIKHITHLRYPDHKTDAKEATSPATHASYQTRKYQLRYNLLRADRTIYLPPELSDITGLGLSPDGYSLIATNYFDGNIYFIDKWRGDLERKFRFRRRAKYKGIEAVRQDIFVVKENGTIFHLSNTDSEKPKTKVYDTSLTAKHAVHGLAYNPQHHELLLVCQGNGGNRESDESKSIYKYDLNTKELMGVPLFLIDDTDLNAYLDRFKPKQEDKGDELFYTPAPPKPFQPSALAVHPQSGELFILSASNLQLAILSQDGKLLHVEKLDPFLFSQPEGMCFDTDGTLYITSKGGKGMTGKILLFNPVFDNRYPS